MNLTLFHFKELTKAGYSLDMLCFTALVEQGNDPEDMCTDDAKMKVLYQTVRRKGLLSEANKITLVGKEMLDFLNEKIEQPKIPKKKKSDDFDKWWNQYPGTDTFTYKSQSFTGTRGMRVKKEDCKIKFNNIVGEGDYTSIELIAALEYEVLQKKENSFKTRTNRLTFMQNSLTYLNQRSFEPFIELIREGKTIKESAEPFKGMDI
jgi:CRISPR/Cas system CSM-associated protein Csm2 small subunit